jgi:HTH-type transcriptional regulator/antitoxin HigA
MTANNPVRPIRTEADYEAALAEIDHLLDATEGSAEAERLELLSILVEAYEEVHHPIDPPDPIDAIRFRMEQQGLSRRDLEAYIGSRARVSEILNRQRPLTLAMIRRLHRGLGIPADSLIQTLPPSRKRTASSRRGARGRWKQAAQG